MAKKEARVLLKSGSHVAKALPFAITAAVIAILGVVAFGSGWHDILRWLGFLLFAYLSIRVANLVLRSIPPRHHAEVIVTIQNNKYFRLYDGSDNPCCWQVDALGADIDRLFEQLGIKYEVMSEDWGRSYSWSANDAVFWMNVECSDTDTCQFRLALAAAENRLKVFRRNAVHPEELCPEVLSGLRELNRLPSN